MAACFLKQHANALVLASVVYILLSCAAGGTGQVFLTGIQAGASAPLQLTCMSGGALFSPLEKLSGAPPQVPFSIVVPAAQALVVFTSDEAVQAAGFAVTWDPGPFCARSTVLTAALGTLTDGSPPGVPYRPWTQCEWMISPGYSPVVLRFRRFSLADADTVTVYDGARDGGMLATFTGAAMRGTLPPAVSTDGAAGAWAGGQATLFEFAFPASNTTPSALMLVVFTASGGPGGSGFEATWRPQSGPALGPSIALSAAVIIGAVVLGLACGTGLGLLIIKCYSYRRYRSFGGRLLSLPEFALLAWALGHRTTPASPGGRGGPDFTIAAFRPGEAGAAQEQPGGVAVPGEQADRAQL
ncbi:hypothetical protein WJX81_007085 [Elliptochloris bilobata]|uniref:CUB domain-containing protein n=1 Tax=Elliptochloris bilobata TaxID=381761 RepID=A0AAW1QIQ0_9CHLO